MSIATKIVFIIVSPFILIYIYVLIFWIIYLPLKFIYEYLIPYGELKGTAKFFNNLKIKR